MPNDHEQFHYPKPNEERDRRARGDDPPAVQHDPPSDPIDLTREQERRRKIVERQMNAMVEKQGRDRTRAIWPYVLVRAYLGDHGVRPAPNNFFWESPDILIARGNLSNFDESQLTSSPVPGQPHTVFVRVWNLGRFAAFGGELRVYWANPSFAFTDNNILGNLIGTAPFELPDRRDPNCHALFRAIGTWVPIVENDGHECLLAKVGCFGDGAPASWDASVHRHVGQRNINLASGGQNLMPMFNILGRNLPANADIQLLHGMADMRPLLQAHDPQMAQRLHVPTRTPAGAYPLAGGYAHLGAVTYNGGQPYLIPAEVVGPRYNPNGIDPGLLANPAVRRLSGSPIAGLVKQAGSNIQPGCWDGWLPSAITRLFNLMPGGGFTADELAQRLNARPGEGHLIRIVASSGGRVVGGYSLIVHR